jgi:LemA protein
MSGALLGSVALLGIVALFFGTLIVGVWAVVSYNRLVAFRNHCDEAWANVDTELERRHDLIPQLVATVKGYAAHERNVLAQVTRLRQQALASPGPTADHARREGDLSRALDYLMVRAEAYPALTADHHFLQLQWELTNTADRIQSALRFYNGNVRELNNRVLQFPSSLIAGLGGFSVRDYFEPGPGANRTPPVNF